MEVGVLMLLIKVSSKDPCLLVVSKVCLVKYTHNRFFTKFFIINFDLSPRIFTGKVFRADQLKVFFSRFFPYSYAHVIPFQLSELFVAHVIPFQLSELFVNLKDLF